MNGSTALRLVLSLLVLFLAFPLGQAQAIQKVSCKPPKITKWQGQAAMSIEAGKQECDEAARMIKEAQNLKKEAKAHNNKAGKQRKRAEKIRNEAKDKRKAAKISADAGHDVVRSSEDKQRRLQEKADLIASFGEGFSQNISFRIEGADTTTAPVYNNLEWADAQKLSVESVEAYQEALLILDEGEQEAVEELERLFEEEAMMLETNADIQELRADQFAAAAVAAELAAEKIENAARVRERAATLFYVKGALAFIESKSDDEGAQKEIGKAIKYVENNMKALPTVVVRHAQKVIAASR